MKIIDRIFGSLLVLAGCGHTVGTWDEAEQKPRRFFFYSSFVLHHCLGYFTTTKTSRGSAKSRADGVMMVRGPT
jgi:hypothetical protein